MQKQNFKWEQMTMGTCYYPEHWDKSLWESDLDRMLEEGITVIRIAEFAWNKVEPEEGTFTYEFFDEFLNLCANKKMSVIFGTPSATPPAWLTEKYPEVLNGDRDGNLYRHGGRRHYNYNSSKYRELVSRIIEKEASHYGQHPAIVGWQIDNEINCEMDEFYSEADTVAFRSFLKNKYGDLNGLNKAWGTNFWNQTYTDWNQVYIPRKILNQGNNPHQHLDYIRFISESANSFAGMQAAIIRKYKKTGDFITTNGRFGNLDNHRMENENLDVYTYDSYPDFAYTLDSDPLHSDDLNDRRWSLYLSEVRSICPHFGIMEQQSGALGWTTRMEAPAPRPGQLRLWALQSVANGADFISFFRWRTATIGTEIYWHGILDYDNRDNRKLSEVKQFYEDFRKLDEVVGADYTSSFGLLKDYDNEWDQRVDAWHRRIAECSEKGVFVAAQKAHSPYDIIYMKEETTAEELKKYPVLFYPHPMIMTRKRADLLKSYVEGGGKLVIGCRAGLKDEHGQMVMLAQPGLLQELTGTDVREFTFVSPAEPVVTTDIRITDDIIKTVPMAVYNDVLTPLVGTEVLATYNNCYYKNEAAITRHRVGKGEVYHVGATFSEDLTKELLQYLQLSEPFSEDLTVPEDVELIRREKNEKVWYFLLNYQPTETEVVLHKEMQNVFDGSMQQGEVALPPYGVTVLKTFN